MVRKFHAALMTQNELSDLIPNVEAVLPHVDSVTVVDGGSTDLTISYMRNWSREEPKIRFFVHPWQDDFPAQRNNYVKHVAEIAEPGDWLVTFDPDEYYDLETLQKLHKAADRAEEKGCNMIGLRCRSVTMRGNKRVWENLDEYWKHLIIRWDPSFHYTGFKCHEGKGGIPHLIMNTTLIYEHRKQDNIIWERGARNSFTAGGGDNLGARNPWWVKLRSLLKDKLGIDDWHSCKCYLIAGDVDSELKQLMIDHMYEGTPKAGPNAVSNRPWGPESEMREWYRYYFRTLHPEEEPEVFRGVNLDDWNI